MDPGAFPSRFIHAVLADSPASPRAVVETEHVLHGCDEKLHSTMIVVLVDRKRSIQLRLEMVGFIRRDAHIHSDAM